MKTNLAFGAVLLLSLFALNSCNDFADSPYPTLKVEQVYTAPGLARATATSFVIDGNAYITLGRPGGNHTKSITDCWQFNPTNNTWIRKADFPGYGRVGAIAEVIDGKAYVGLGYNSDLGVYASDTTIFSDFRVYDPGLDNWTPRASFPSKAGSKDAPVNSCSSFTYKNRIYLFALSAQTFMSKEVWRYDASNNKWEQMADFPGEARTAAVSCTDGNHFYYGLGTGNKNDWWEYFPETDKWKKRCPMPGNGRVNAVALSVNHRFFVATGRHMGGSLTTGRFFNDIVEYDAAKDTWYKRGTIPTAGRENAIGFVIGNKAFIGFGETDEIRFNDLWSFEP